MEELETRRERSVVRRWNNGEVRGGNTGGIFFIKKKEGHVHLSKGSKNKLREKRLGIVPISLLQCASNTPWVYKQVCNLQIPHIFKVPSSLPSFLMELSSCDKLIWSCFYSFSHMQSLFLEIERTMLPKPGHDVKPTVFSAHLFQNHLFC